MTNRIIATLLDAMRSSDARPVQYERALQVLAWTALSAREEIEPDLRISQAVAADDQKLLWIVRTIATRGELHGHAFASLCNIRREQIPALRFGLECALRFLALGLLNSVTAEELAPPASVLDGEPVIPAELANLLVRIGSAMSDGLRDVYVGWDAGGEIAARALQGGSKVHCEAPSAPVFVSLTGLIVGGMLTVRHADPIRDPGVASRGRLERFPTAIGFPPIGARYETEVSEMDLLHRFPEKTGLVSVLAIRHLTAVASRSVVVCVPNSLLFGLSAERDLRKYLVDAGQLRAVISLPPGLLPLASIGLSILVIAPAGGGRSVRMINADEEPFRRMISKTRSVLDNTDALVSALVGEPDDYSARDVPLSEVAANDYQLQVARYLIPEEQQKIRSMLDGAEMVPLGQLVQILRPPAAKSKPSSDVLLREVGVSDLSPYGYVEQASRQISVDRELAKKLAKYHLRPLDIVLTIKGSVGKVGLISEAILGSDVPWVAGQSSITLRVIGPNVDPRALFLLLRSPLGQALISGIVSAGTVPFIQTRELEALALPLPSVVQQAEVVAVLREEAVIQEQIAHLQDQLAKLSAPLWAIN